VLLGSSQQLLVGCQVGEGAVWELGNLFEVGEEWVVVVRP